jgi:hypothetical protein
LEPGTVGFLYCHARSKSETFVEAVIDG